MPTLPRNQLRVDRATAIDGKRTVYRIDGVAGLELEISPTGSRVWRVRYPIGYGRQGRRQRRLRIGDARAINLGQATRRALEALSQVALEAKDPQAQRVSPAGDSFARLVLDWLEYAKEHKRSWAADEALYRRHIASRLGHLAVRDVTRTAIIAALRDIKDKVSGIQANRCQTVISSTFSWAQDEGRVDSHPATRIRKQVPNTFRSRVYSDDELQKIWKAADQLNPSRCAAVRLLMLTGQRLSEIVEAARTDVDLDAATLTVPAERRKSWRKGKLPVPHLVPLTSAAVLIFHEAISRARQSKFVFPNRTLANDTPMQPKGLSSAFGLLMRDNNIDDAHLHDLRHAVKTGMARLGVPEAIADRVQDHASGRGTGAQYDHYTYLSEKRRALELWTRRLLEIVEGRPASRERW